MYATCASAKLPISFSQLRYKKSAHMIQVHISCRVKYDSTKKKPTSSTLITLYALFASSKLGGHITVTNNTINSFRYSNNYSVQIQMMSFTKLIKKHALTFNSYTSFPTIVHVQNVHLFLRAQICTFMCCTYLETANLLLIAAQWRGVIPSLSAVLMFIPSSSTNCLHLSKWPY